MSSNTPRRFFLWTTALFFFLPVQGVLWTPDGSGVEAQEVQPNATPTPERGTRDVVAEFERQFGPKGIGRRGPPTFTHNTFDTGHLSWILAGITASAIVSAGYMLFHAASWGESAESISSSTLAMTAMLSLTWVIWIYSFSFAHNLGASQVPTEEIREHSGTPVLGSGEYLAMNKITPQIGGSTHEFPVRRPSDVVPQLSHMTFHMFVFLSAATPLIIGLRGRVQFAWLLAAMAIWGTCVYAPIAHWIWGYGWLRQRGVLDFAGGVVVHLTCGISALGAAIALRNQPHSLYEASKPRETWMCLGAAIAWIGSLVMHAAFQGLASPGGLTALLNAHLAACTGGIGWAGLEWLKKGKTSVADFAAGILCGLATISAGSGYVSPQSALVIGLLGGVSGRIVDTWFFHMKLHSVLSRIFSIHGVGGIAGVLLTAVFVTPAVSFVPHGGGVMGLIGGNTIPLREQSLAVGVTAAWTLIISILVFLVVRWLASRRKPVLN